MAYNWRSVWLYLISKILQFLCIETDWRQNCYPMVALTGKPPVSRSKNMTFYYWQVSHLSVIVKIYHWWHWHVNHLSIDEKYHWQVKQLSVNVKCYHWQVKHLSNNKKEHKILVTDRYNTCQNHGADRYFTCLYYRKITIS